MIVKTRPLNKGERFCCTMKTAKELFSDTDIYLDFAYLGRHYSTFGRSPDAFYLKNHIKGGVILSLVLDNIDLSQPYWSQSLNDIFAIPLTTVGDELDMITVVMEAMASEGYRTLEPAYYEVALKSKYAKDEESVKMLDLVIERLYVDPGFLYVDNTAGFHQNMRSWIGKNASNVASAFTANESIILKNWIY